MNGHCKAMLRASEPVGILGKGYFSGRSLENFKDLAF